MSDYIIGYTVYYWTDDYLKWEYDNEDGGAGDDVNGVDRLQLTLEKG